MKTLGKKVILAVAIFTATFLAMGVTILFFIHQEERYCLEKNLTGGPADKSMEARVKTKRINYLRKTLILDENTARKLMDFKKHKGTEKEAIYAQRLEEAFDNHPRPELLREINFLLVPGNLK